MAKALQGFSNRHIGINSEDLKHMLETIHVDSLDQLIDETIPAQIRIAEDLKIPEAISEHEYFRALDKIAQKNVIAKNFIGHGYYGTITPSVILRNIFQNPGWYTQYTPYQAEISQGRLEALLNFQTMVSDLTGLPLANASLLDEGTAAAEAMAMFYAIVNKKRNTNPATKFLVDATTFDQTWSVLKSRSIPLGIELVKANALTHEVDESYFGVLLQYPNAHGEVEEYSALVDGLHQKGLMVCAAADLLSLTLLKSPGSWGADVVVGNTQRFGVPMGYGGPHAAYFATREEYKRQIPGRIIGVSVDKQGNRALRMALQTREQHIKREKATSNICTAQALLAIMAGMYAVYHGPDGLTSIAEEIRYKTALLKTSLSKAGFSIDTSVCFDTFKINLEKERVAHLLTRANESAFNFYFGGDFICISIDESHSLNDIKEVFEFLCSALDQSGTFETEISIADIPDDLKRKSPFLTHHIFNTHRSETSMMRYIKSLENKDLSLMHAMIPLGSCTMKLNAATQLIPVSWPEFANIHPFAPAHQVEGYAQIFKELEAYLCQCTGFSACSLQPNSGAQGEFAGLMVIREYHLDHGDAHRNIAIIPSSAHGTNPASAVMAGMKVVIVKCDEKGNIELEDLKAKAEEHKENLAALMVTYPSTHGVFEESIKEICQTIHDHGGLVYMDGANMNAQVGLTSPNEIGADVCHLNLHKTFAIPHGGGGPGMGPICCNDKLAKYLPGHALAKTGGDKPIHSISSAPWGSASILLISYAYIRLLGKDGLVDATKYAILNANYIKSRLEGAYSILYAGKKNRSAHEFIIDLRSYKAIGVSTEDVAKRLIDYGFHAPTMSFPVPGTIMIEPTESEDLKELDRFCDAMLQIKEEIDEVARGDMDPESNVLTNAPHTLKVITADEFPFDYARSKAAYPLPYLKERNKFWPSVARVDNAFGDRNLICTCPPIESYASSED